MDFVISLEQLSLKHQSRLPMLLYRHIEKMVGHYATHDDIQDDAIRGIETIIKDTTNISTSVSVGDTPGYASVNVPALAGSHAATNKRKDIKQREAIEAYLPFLNGSVDLEKVRVEGSFTKIVFDMSLDTDLFALPPDQATAVILHEIGHIFWSFATIGDYVWLNYYLIDGIDILLGKKKNVYRVNIMTLDELKSKTSQEGKDALKGKTDETAVRRAIIGFFTDPGRHHLHSVSKRSSWKRDEQLADWFMARLGFALPYARLIKRDDSSITKSSLSAVIVQAGLIGAALVPYFTPIIVAGWLLDLAGQSHYDTSKERIEKLKRETIAQLTALGKRDRKREQQLLADIKEFNLILNKMNDVPNGLQLIGYLIAPPVRRERQALRHEQLLETFMNNELFVIGSKLRQYL